MRRRHWILRFFYYIHIFFMAHKKRWLSFLNALNWNWLAVLPQNKNTGTMIVAERKWTISTYNLRIYKMNGKKIERPNKLFFRPINLLRFVIQFNWWIASMFMCTCVQRGVRCYCDPVLLFVCMFCFYSHLFLLAG